MKLHHAVRLRLLAQRLGAPGVISPKNGGMSLHALRQLGIFNTQDKRLLKQLDDLYSGADIRLRANMFHCLACCVREQQSVYEGLPEALPSLLLKMQECMLTDVDDFSPTECILVMEGIVKVKPYCCVAPQLAAVLRGRLTALVDVASNPVDLIGIARIIVELMQETHCCFTGDAEDDYDQRFEWSQELHRVGETIKLRLESFSKQDLLTLVDAVTLRVTPGARTIAEDDRERLQTSDEWASRSVPEECRSLVLQTLSRACHFLTTYSSSQVSAWTSRVIYLRFQHYPLFTGLLQRLDEERVRDAMSLSQLSTCIECLGRVLCVDVKDDSMNHTDQQFVARVEVKLLVTLVSCLEKSGGSRRDCSVYLIPALLSLSEGVRKGKLEISRSLMERLFRIPYKNFETLTPRERADTVTIVFLWGLLKKSFNRQRQQRGIIRHHKEEKDVSLLSSWCDAVLAYISSYSLLDALQIINEVSAAVYVEAISGDAYDLPLVRSMLFRLHERVQGVASNLDSVPSSYLACYLSSMSKLGLRRKADYYRVLNILQQRELTDFERLRVLGVVARHHLRAMSFLSQTVTRIPQWVSLLHPRQKCLLLKYLGQARAHRFIQTPSHSSLELGAFLTREEVLSGLPILEAVFAFVGLVELRQFENKTLSSLIEGPLSQCDSLSDILSATFLGEFIVALCRIDWHLVPASILKATLDLAACRLTLSRSFFVDLAEFSFWLRLVRERPFLIGATVDENEKGTKDCMAAVENYISVAAAIAKTRLLDISGSSDLQPNTFLFNQMAIGYRLGVKLPREIEERLSQHLDTKHLSQLLGDPRQIVSAVTTARHICYVNSAVAMEVFQFAVRVFGSLGVQEMLILGVEMTESLRRASDVDVRALEIMRKLHTLAVQNVTDARRLKKLSVQERALGIRYGIVEGE